MVVEAGVVGAAAILNISCNSNYKKITTLNSSVQLKMMKKNSINPVLISPVLIAASSFTSSHVPSAVETRLSLVAALASHAFSLSLKLGSEAVAEVPKYLLPKRMEARNLEELFMSIPDLETVKYKILKRTEQYEIRVVAPYFVAETTLPGKTGFDFYASSRGFNILAEYLFGKNEASESMEMTTPVYVEKSQSSGEKMEMTTPVITRASEDQNSWRMSFVMPSKYGNKLPTPKDPSVRIKEVPSRTIAVAAFPGFVTDEEVKQRELKLRDALKNDAVYQVKENAAVEVAQFNPPFTVPFMRRNEVAFEIEPRGK